MNLTEGRKKMDMKKRSENGLKRPRRADFRTTDTEYEWMLREAFESGLGSLNEWICANLIPKNMTERLTKLRAKHRKANEPDVKFYHAAKLRELGRPIKTGRHALEQFSAA